MSPTVFERTEEIRAEFLATAADLAAQIEALTEQRRQALHMAHSIAEEAQKAQRLMQPPPADQALAAVTGPSAPPPVGDVAVANDPAQTVTDAGRLPFRGTDNGAAQSVVDRTRTQSADPGGGLSEQDGQADG